MYNLDDSIPNLNLFAFARNAKRFAIVYVLFLVFCQRYRNFGIVFLILKISNKADRAGEVSFFRGIHVRIDIKIVISIITTFDKQKHLEEFTQMRLIEQVLVNSLVQDQFPLPECLWPSN